MNSYSRNQLLCGSLRNPIFLFLVFMILEIGILIFLVVVGWGTDDKEVIGVSDKKETRAKGESR